MTMKFRVGAASAMFAAIFAMTYASAASFLEGGKDEHAIVMKVAAAVKKGDAAGTKKAAEDGAKKFEEVADLMHLFRPRNKGGMGWGAKAGTNPATDGLEKKIQEFAKGVPPNYAAQAEANVEAATWIRALAEITLAKVPAKDQSGGKTKKAWIGWAEDMRTASADFGKAAAAKNAGDMSKAASKINSICINCHSKFKE